MLTWSTPKGSLASLRVLDLSDDDGDAVTRLLADLGADVLKVEPPGGSPSRTQSADAGAESAFLRAAQREQARHRARPVRPNDRERFIELAGSADIVVDSGVPGQAAAYGTSCAAWPIGSRTWWRCRSPISAGPGRARRGGPPTRCSTHCRGRCPGRAPPPGTPVLPPDGIASATAAVQAAWAALVAYYNRLRCGTGDYIDFSRFEAVVTTLDPPFGTQGQAAAAVRRPNGGAADRGTRTPTRSSPATTATSGSA